MTKVAVLIKEVVTESMEDKTGILAAALAFYTVLSLAPALLVVVAIAGAWFGRVEVQAEIVNTAHEMLGLTAAETIEGVLRQLESHSSAATIAGVVSMFFGATVVFAALQDGLNQIWKVTPVARGYVRGFLIKRLISFSMVLLMGGVLSVSLILATVVAGLSQWVPQSLPASAFLLQAVNFVVSFALMTVMFAVVYKVLPDAYVRWRDVWVGAAVTALLFTVGKTLIALYLGKTTTASAYGAAGSLVVFLLWVYYSAQIFLFGSVFTETYARLHGAPITSRAARRAARLAAIQEARERRVAAQQDESSPQPAN
jgi:membrane protein